MNELSISVTHSSATEARVVVIKPSAMKLDRQALRGLIMASVAHSIGTTGAALYDAGWDRQHTIGWELKRGPKPEVINRVAMHYTIRPMSAAEQTQALHDRGGAVKNADGSMSFWMPGEHPVPVVQHPRVRHQR